MRNKGGKRNHRDQWMWIMLVGGLVFGGFRCSKGSGTTANKALVAVTSTYEHGDIDIRYGLPPASILDAPVAYGFTSGAPRNNYVQATAGVRLMSIYRNSDTLATGYTTFSSGGVYTMFVYNDSNSTAARLFVKQDFFTVRFDTISYIRFFNFSPGASSFYQFKMVNRQGDSLVTTFLNYVGNSQSGSSYQFQQIPIGTYGMRVFRDIARTDSLQLADSFRIDTGRSVTAYVQGYYDSLGDKKMRLRTILHN